LPPALAPGTKLHVTYVPDEDGSGHVRGWVASIVDITERKQVEVAFRESHQRLRWLASIVEFSDDAIVARTSMALSRAGTRVRSVSSATLPKKQSGSLSKFLFRRIGMMKNVKS
jgi:PAS domain-containing protein